VRVVEGDLRDATAVEQPLDGDLRGYSTDRALPMSDTRKNLAKS
jgi:hypothetical protein